MAELPPPPSSGEPAVAPPQPCPSDLLALPGPPSISPHLHLRPIPRPSCPEKTHQQSRMTMATVPPPPLRSCRPRPSLRLHLQPTPRSGLPVVGPPPVPGSGRLPRSPPPFRSKSTWKACMLGGCGLLWLCDFSFFCSFVVVVFAGLVPL